MRAHPKRSGGPRTSFLHKIRSSWPPRERKRKREGEREEAKTRIKRGQERDAKRLENPVGSSERYRRREGRWRETEETEGAEEEEEEEEGG